MNSWNFNELTEQDLFDFKMCKHSKTGEVYGIKDSSTCQSGKEITEDDVFKLSDKANKGDVKAKKQLDEIKKARATAKTENAKAKKEEEAKKKKEEAGKDKKGKGGKGKKGGGKKAGGKGKGKGKAGGKGAAKGGKGGGKSAGNTTSRRQATEKEAAKKMQQNRKERQQAMRKRLGDLQKSLRSVQNPEVRKALEGQISDLLKGASEVSKMDAGSTTSPKAPSSAAANKPEVNRITG